MTERAKKLLLLYCKQGGKIRRVSGLPLLTFKAKKAGTLNNYRIYGNTETKTRSYSGSAPLSFPIEDGAVSNYRVYGQTSRNLFEYDSEEVYSNSTLGNLNHWDYADFSTGTVLRIPCTSNTTYTLSIADDIEHNVFRISTTYLDITPPHEVQSGQTGGVQCSNLINDGTLRTATFTTSETAKYILFQTNTNIFQNAIETLMLNVGSTGLPYEPYGESVGDKTANILPLSRTPITETHGDFLCEYDGLGAITLTTDKDNAATGGEFVIPLIHNFTVPVSVGQGGTGCFQINNSITGGSANTITVHYNNTRIDTWNFNELNRFHSNYTSMGNKTIDSISVRINNGGTNRKITIKPAFVENVTEQVPFEPYGYRIPITNNSETANIYLDELLTKSGDNADYIDYAEQKRYNADGTSGDVTLPALPAQSSTNSLSVGTSVQPSSVAVDVAEVVSCGDRTGNLFNINDLSNGSISVADGVSIISNNQKHTETYIPVNGSQSYTLTVRATLRVHQYSSDYSYLGSTLEGGTFITNANAAFIRLAGSKEIFTDIVMLNMGSTALPYEPYGYKVPVTVSNGTDTQTIPIYLSEQIKKVGDEAEYIDYAEQKQHRVRKNLFDEKYENIPENLPIYEPIYVGDGYFTLSTTTPLNANSAANLFLMSGDVQIGASTATTGVWSGHKGTVESVNGYITVAYRYQYGADPRNYKTMLNSGSEPLAYEPYIEDTEVDVTLPEIAVTAGTNVLSVGTEAQPSDIYLKGKIKKKPKIYYKIYYYSQDGQTALSTETVEEGHDCTYSTVPTKESDTDFNYTFTGWSTTTNSTTATAGATENIQQNTNLYAAFSKSFKTDTISDSWEEIIANCDNGTYASKYQIGDLKTIDVGTEGPVQMQIVAIDTDLLASDNTKKAPITWISKQLLNTDKVMNDTSTNYLSDWTNCDMRTYLKNTVLPMLPSVVQNNIKEVTKYTNQRTGSTTFTTISSTEDIWLPSYREISNNTSNCETSGVQYNSIFTDDASRVKSKVGNRANIWWTRSASGHSSSACSYSFVIVYNDGTANRTGSYCIGFCGVAIGFCT